MLVEYSGIKIYMHQAPTRSSSVLSRYRNKSNPTMDQSNASQTLKYKLLGDPYD